MVSVIDPNGACVMTLKDLLPYVAVMVWACERPPAAVVDVPYSQSFEHALGAEWNSRGGEWRVVDGRLFNDGAHNVPLWLSLDLPADVIVDFVAETHSPEIDIKFEIYGDGINHESGYVFILSGWTNKTSLIARLDEHAPRRTPAQTRLLKQEVAADAVAAQRKHADRKETVGRANTSQPGRPYRLRFERRSNMLKFFVDDTLHLELFDPAPLRGQRNNRFAFNNWASRVYFDDLEIRGLD